ncbi:MAG: pyridoxal 5'-phosphate synthase glutaminase subunit PdxT [Fidelibacterota bacterium]
MTTIGVLGLQGDFERHQAVFAHLEVSPRKVRYPGDLEGCQALIIPGGESTTISRLLDFIGLRDTILEFAKVHPVLGTCAGMILMAREVNDARIRPLGLMDIEVERNAYGRQVESFTAAVDFHANGQREALKGIFIRAPRIKSVGDRVEILASLHGEPVFVRDGHHLATAFHPELSDSMTIHSYLLTLSGKTESVP